MKNLLMITLVLFIILLLQVLKRHDSSHMLQVYNFKNKIRLGENADGGYVIGDLGSVYDCYISAGVSNEESFSRDFIKKYNMDKTNCFAFDGTIEDYPYHYTKNITYIKKNINSFNDDKNTDLSFLTDKYKSIFLKMDIEGGEYPWIENLDTKTLKKFKQIVLEFHDLSETGDNKSHIFEKLNKTHYMVHIHGNNHSPAYPKSVPTVIEVAYINKNCFKSRPPLNTQAFPHKLDFANKGSVPDIDLNFFPFVHEKPLYQKLSSIFT